MTQYSLDNIREHNRKPHEDIERDIQAQQNGQFSFVLRTNNGNIVDYSVVEYVNARKYLTGKVIVTELRVERYFRNGTNPSP